MVRDIRIDKIDPQILPVVQFLWNNGYETFTSCQGGKDHAYQVPTIGIEFRLNRSEYFDFMFKLKELLEKQFKFFAINNRMASSYLSSKNKRVWIENVYVEFSKNEIVNWKAK